MPRKARVSKAEPVDTVTGEGRIALSPMSSPRYSLDELIAGITEDNLHGQIDAGPAAGNEAL